MSSPSLPSYSLPGLGDLRAPGERVGEPPARLLVGELVVDGLPYFFRQPDLKLLALRCRVVATHYHDIGEDLIERSPEPAVGGCWPADHAAQEPARPVDS